MVSSKKHTYTGLAGNYHLVGLKPLEDVFKFIIEHIFNVFGPDVKTTESSAYIKVEALWRTRCISFT